MHPSSLIIRVQENVVVAASTRSAVSSMTVPEHGNGVTLNLSTSVAELFESDFTLLVDGQPFPFSIQGGGTVWELSFTLDWITVDQEVTLAYAGSQLVRFATTAVTNNSIVTARGRELVARRRSYHLCFDLTTYYIAEFGIPGSQFAPGDADPDIFNPTSLTQTADIDNWLDAAEAFGAASIMLTCKHVCGFCMWESTISADYCITAATTWWAANGFDITAAYLSRARARGLKVGVYFSIWDRAFEVANPTPSDAEYTAFIHAQLTELLTNYGEIDEILLDAWAGIADYPSYTKVNKASTLALIRSLQPDITILLNDYVQDLVDKDVNLYEEGLGEVIELPLAGNRMPCRTWMTPTNTGTSWYDDAAYRNQYLSVADRRARIATAVGRQSEIMMNLSPDITGLIDADRIAYLEELT